jgi:hypothetical protein
MAEQSWTDDPITAGSNRIRKKSVHFTELQDAINAWETAYSIANTNYSDSPAAGVKIKTTAITEMQDALDVLYNLVDSTSFNWTEASTPKTIKPAHINELRTNMNMMQNDHCYQCDLCDTETGCNLCNLGCYNDACPCDSACYTYNCPCNVSCNLEGCKSSDACNCYGYTTCSCNTGHNPCDLCDNACYEDSCNQCHVVNYRYPWT